MAGPAHPGGEVRLLRAARPDAGQSQGLPGGGLRHAGLPHAWRAPATGWCVPTAPPPRHFLRVQRAMLEAEGALHRRRPGGARRLPVDGA